MVKFYGIVFLGQPREELAEAHDAGPAERAGLLWLALWCVILGIAPVFVVITMDPDLAHAGGRDTAGEPAAIRLGVPDRDSTGASKLQSAHLSSGHRRCGAGDDFCWCAASTMAGCGARQPGTAVSRRRRRACRTARRDSASPSSRSSSRSSRSSATIPSPFDEFPQYSSKIDDRLWYWLYLPIVKLTERLSSLVGVLHHGRISLYLAYSFVTLLLLLLLVR